MSSFLRGLFSPVFLINSYKYYLRLVALSVTIITVSVLKKVKDTSTQGPFPAIKTHLQHCINSVTSGCIWSLHLRTERCG